MKSSALFASSPKDHQWVVEPSVLKDIVLEKNVPDRFKLGMSEWTDSDDDKENDDFQPPKKRLSLPVHKSKQRFAEVTSSEELDRVSKSFVPKNTEKNTKWALSTFQQWILSRNQRCADTLDSEILIGDPGDCLELCRVLSLFVVEARKSNGEPYPAKTIYHLISGLLRYARSIQPHCPNFLDPKDVRFKKLQGTMDLLTQTLALKMMHLWILCYHLLI